MFFPTLAVLSSLTTATLGQSISPAGMSFPGSYINALTSLIGAPPATNLLNPSTDLIDLDLILGILGPAQCGPGSIVGVDVALDLFGLVDICVCVSVLSLGTQKACPSCPANAK